MIHRNPIIALNKLAPPGANGKGIASLHEIITDGTTERLREWRVFYLLKGKAGSTEVFATNEIEAWRKVKAAMADAQIEKVILIE